MATGAAAAAVAGTVITIEGQRREARAQASAARQNAKAKRLQALELLDRFDINSQALVLEGELVKGKQKISFASKGIDIGSGSALSTIEETNAIVAKQLILDKKEADFKVEQLRAGADADLTLAGDIKSSQRLRSLGTLFSGVGQTATALGTK